jgi:hypothetical protein
MTYHASEQVDGFDLVDRPFFGSRQVFPETVMRQRQRIDHAAAPSQRGANATERAAPTPPRDQKLRSNALLVLDVGWA